MASPLPRAEDTAVNETTIAKISKCVHVAGPELRALCAQTHFKFTTVNMSNITLQMKKLRS